MLQFAKTVSLFSCVLLGSAAMIPAKADPAATWTWTGAYVGGSAGYGWGNSTIGAYESVPDPLALELSPFDVKSRASGFVGGAQAGYNWQNGRWLFGIEADFSYADINRTAHYGPLSSPNGIVDPITHYAANQRMDWFATLRPRVGVAATDRLLAYVTAGLAIAHVKTSTLFYFGPFTKYSAADTATQAGWTAGGGLEWKIDSRWSAKTEYLYYDLGKRTLIAPTNFPDFSYVSTLDTRGHIVRVGLNYGL